MKMILVKRKMCILIRFSGNIIVSTKTFLLPPTSAKINHVRNKITF